MSAVYYYKRKTSLAKRLAIILAVVLALGFLYWFYANYFSKIDISGQGGSSAGKTEETAKTLLINLSVVSGDAQMAVNGADYIAAQPNTILHQGDKIKTASGRVVLNLDNGSIIRLGENTEITLKNTDNQNFLIEQAAGRAYYNLSEGANYQVKSLNVLTTALGTKFEVIADASANSLAILAIERKVKVEILDSNNDFLVGARLDSGEKALIDLKALKKDMLKFDTFNTKTLTSENWYKWNFDLDKGLDTTVAIEPKFEEVKDSLQLSAAIKENGIYLSWSAYNNDDFKNYQIVRSDTNANPQYPKDVVIKTSSDKGLNSYLDASAEKNKKYYYRVCIVKISNDIACGTVSGVQAQATEEKDTVKPQAPILQATISESGVNLAWSKNQDFDFKEYAVLRSLANLSPLYPADKFISKKINQENYLDKEVNITSAGGYYYRVCSVDVSGNFNCSNTTSVIEGKIQ